MKTYILVFSALLVPGAASADPYVIARQQALRVSDQNNAEQARIAKAAAEPAAPTDLALQATMENIGDLQGNFAAYINGDGQPDAPRKTSLLNFLTQAAQSKKATSDSVKKLAADLSVALAQRKKITTAQQKKLAIDVHALFNSSHLSAAQQATMSDDVQKTLLAAGVGQDDATGLVADLKKIADETK